MKRHTIYGVDEDGDEISEVDEKGDWYPADEVDTERANLREALKQISIRTIGSIGANPPSWKIDRLALKEIHDIVEEVTG